MKPLFEIARLECEVGTRVRLDAPLRIGAGEIVALTGPSGAGKSIFLRALALLDPAEIEGLHMGDDTPEALGPAHWRAHVGYLPPDAALWGNPVREDFERVLALKAHSGRQLDLAHAQSLLTELGLPEVLGADSTRLSSGEKQRITLARILWRAPDVLLLDEPTGALDAKMRERAQELIVSWVKNGERPRAAVWITHDEGEARRCCDRCLHVAGGRVREVEEPR